MPDRNELAFVDGGPAAEELPWTSLWAALFERAAIDPDRLALLSPAQPAALLAELVKPWPRRETEKEAGWSAATLCGGSLRRGWRKATSPLCLLSHALSFVLPAPSLGAGRGYLQWSFADLERGSRRLGAALERRGVGNGATAVLFTPVCAEWALLLAVASLKGYTAATLPRTGLETGEISAALRGQLKTLAPALLVASTEEEARVLASDASATKNMAVGICLQWFATTPPRGWLSLEDLAAEMSETRETDGCVQMSTGWSPPEKLAAEDPNRTAFVVYTSGSTGWPKGSPVTVKSCLSAFALMSGVFVPLLPVPMGLVSGHSFQARCPTLTLACWATGHAAVLDSAAGSDAETILAAVQKGRPLMLSVLVTSLRSLARAPNYSPEAVKSVRVLNLTGATVTLAILRDAQHIFPRATVLPTYAMTEAAALVAWQPKRRVPSVKNMPAFRGVVASGFAVAGASLKVLGPAGEDGTLGLARRGQIGALHLSGKSVIPAYIGGARPESFYTDDEGRSWFITGDHAVIDEDGLLYVLGRSEDSLHRDGEIITPCTVENFLETKFKGTAFAVVKVTRGDKDKEGALYAVFDELSSPSAAASASELIVRELGAAYRIEGIASLGDLGFEKWPVTIGGKTNYRHLRGAIEKCMPLG